MQKQQNYSRKRFLRKCQTEFFCYEFNSVARRAEEQQGCRQYNFWHIYVMLWRQVIRLCGFVCHQTLTFGWICTSKMFDSVLTCPFLLYGPQIQPKLAHNLVHLIFSFKIKQQTKMLVLDNFLKCHVRTVHVVYDQCSIGTPESQKIIDCVLFYKWPVLPSVSQIYCFAFFCISVCRCPLRLHLSKSAWQCNTLELAQNNYWKQEIAGRIESTTFEKLRKKLSSHKIIPFLRPMASKVGTGYWR